MSRTRHLRIAVCRLCVCMIIAGCDSGSGRRIEPPPEPPEATLFSRLWPNEDGNQWAFDYQRHQANAPMIPELEGLEDLDISEIDYLDLEDRLTGDLPEVGETEAVGIATLHFDGTIQSLDGPKQNLVSDLVPITSRTLAAGGLSSRLTQEGPAGVSPLIARIYLARPDLRARMIELGYVPEGHLKASEAQYWPPFSFLDSKFEKQDNWTGIYGDLNADSSYTIIKGPLEEGAFFRHQLVPDLADDIWEYGWILEGRSVETPAGEFEDAFGVVYFIDFGQTLYIDEQGQPIKSFHSFSIASMYFAPDIGPVYQRAIDYLSPPIPELNIDIGILFSEAALRDYELQ